MSEKDIPERKIKYGEYHKYFPIKFDTDIDFNFLCDKISKSSIVFNNDDFEKNKNAFGKSVADMVDEVNKEQKIVQMKMSDYKRYKNCSLDSSVFKPEDIIFRNLDYKKSFCFELLNAKLDSVCRQNERLQKEIEKSEEYYGKRYLECERRFLLHSCKVKLSDGKFVWMQTILYIYANGMGIIKCQLPLINVSIEPLKENDANQYIKEIECQWLEKNQQSLSTFSDVINVYLSKLTRDIKINLLVYNIEFTHIIFVDFEGAPNDINKISESVQEDLFRIICAPVPERAQTSYRKDAIDYIKKHQYGDHNIKYIVKNNGGCLSLIDLKLLNSYKNKLENNDNFQYLELCDSLASNMSVNAEFAFIIIILERANDCNDYFSKRNSRKQLDSIKKEYNLNKLFLCELQSQCMGTVYEQLENFKEKMPYYFKNSIAKERRDAIDNILEQKEQIRREKYQNFLEFASFLFTIVFGLPAIYESLQIIRKCFIFLPSDIPYIKMEILSVIIWLVEIGIIFYNLYGKNRHNR